MLNRFKWYRKLRGGTWIKWFDKILYGGHESWKRYKGSGDAMLDLPEMIKYRCKPMFVENYNSYEIGTDFMLLSMILQANGTGYGHLSDGYHTFDELYEHRNVLFCKYISGMATSRDVWKSKRNADGSTWDGWFVAGISDIITYHIPMELWDMCVVPVVDKGKDNGHTSSDALWNLKHIQYLALGKTVENHQGWMPKPHKLES